MTDMKIEYFDHTIEFPELDDAHKYIWKDIPTGGVVKITTENGVEIIVTISEWGSVYIKKDSI